MMKTYMVSATCCFDWYHFQVKASSSKAAIEKLRPLDGHDMCITEIKYFVDKHDSIIGFSVDEDDLDYGNKYFHLSEYPDTFGVIFSNQRREFVTKEAALNFVNIKLQELGPGYKVKEFEDRGLQFNIMKSL